MGWTGGAGLHCVLLAVSVLASACASGSIGDEASGASRLAAGANRSGTETLLAPAAGVAYPTAPPVQLCGNPDFLTGPAVPPRGSVRVDPGSNLNDLTLANPPGTTFWLAPGTHTLSATEFGQVVPKDANVYVGGPGAVLDGQKINRYAFTQRAANVSIRYLTIQNFVTPRDEGTVNHDSGSGWTIEHNTIQSNGGAGLFLGDDNVARYNCLQSNGQYGLQGYKSGGVRNITLDHNEIAGNNTDDWEAKVPGCGCTGGAKFWAVNGAAVTNNWVHHNKGTGLWADTNNQGFRFEGNYINDNDAHGIFYEISYNALIRNNTFVRNALVKGEAFASRASSFPVGAIYVSESGGHPDVYGGVYSTFEITGNYFKDNWSGVVLWENADRFCGSPANTSSRYCTEGGLATLETCVEGTINHEPYYSGCRWKTQNVLVTDNDFHLDRSAIGCSTTTRSCGVQAVFSNWGTYPDWSPYKGPKIQEAITFHQNNRFRNNRYAGEWRFTPFSTAHLLTLSAWQSPPYDQDVGSTLRSRRR
ncbi:MAG: right-handed parallel beta-helix repeat-containing protein [Actinomycetota bacterium]|nr:right-handed parallel beta-helix repeat-containing protein [Actinomycetota bacterium]